VNLPSPDSTTESIWLLVDKSSIGFVDSGKPLAKPATQSPTFLVRLISVMQVGSVKQPKSGLGAKPESCVIKYE